MYINMCIYYVLKIYIKIFIDKMFRNYWSQMKWNKYRVWKTLWVCNMLGLHKASYSVKFLVVIILKLLTMSPLSFHFESEVTWENGALGCTGEQCAICLETQIALRGHVFCSNQVWIQRYFQWEKFIIFLICVTSLYS